MKITDKEIQLGNSATASQNFVISVPTVQDGSIKIARGNIGATTQDVLSISAAGIVSLPQTLGNYANDSAAATGGVPVNGLYRNGNIVMIRVS